MDRGMPIKTAKERGRELVGRSRVSIAVHRVTDVVWILFVDARQSQIGKTCGGGLIEGRCLSVRLTRSADITEQQNKTESRFHALIIAYRPSSAPKRSWLNDNPSVESLIPYCCKKCFYD